MCKSCNIQQSISRWYPVACHWRAATVNNQYPGGILSPATEELQQSTINIPVVSCILPLKSCISQQSISRWYPVACQWRAAAVNNQYPGGILSPATEELQQSTTNIVVVYCRLSLKSCISQQPISRWYPVACHIRFPFSFPRPLDAKIARNQAPDGRIIAQIAMRVRLIRDTLIFVSSCLSSLCLSICFFACMRVKPEVSEHLCWLI
jgi:hypothetical protein